MICTVHKVYAFSPATRDFLLGHRIGISTVSLCYLSAQNNPISSLIKIPFPNNFLMEAWNQKQTAVYAYNINTLLVYMKCSILKYVLNVATSYIMITHYQRVYHSISIHQHDDLCPLSSKNNDYSIN